MSEFAAKLKDLRLKSNIPQSMIAKEIGVSETQYQNYEYGKHEPKLKYLIKLCEFHKVSADYLLGLPDFENFGKMLHQTDNPDSHKGG